MLDLLKKTMLTGVGLAVLTKEKVEEIGEELVKRGQMSEQEGRQFVDEMMKKSEETQKELEGRIESAVKSAVERLDLATKQDVAELSAKIDAIENKSS